MLVLLNPHCYRGQAPHPPHQEPIRITPGQLACYDATLRRLCNPKNKKKAPQVVVPEEVKKQWLKGGGFRKELLQIMIEAAGNKDR